MFTPFFDSNLNRSKLIAEVFFDTVSTGTGGETNSGRELIGAATGGRPHHRIGDRYQDLEELGHDLKNPAAVK